MLDFKGWKKIAEDKKTTTLAHDKGHVMTVAHGKLPKIQQEALKRLKLDEGGFLSYFGPPKAEAKEPSKENSQKPMDPFQNFATHGISPDQLGQGFKSANQNQAKGGMIRKNYAEGDQVQSEPQAPDVNINVGAPPQASVQSAQPAPIQVPQVPAIPNVLNPSGSLNPSAAAKVGQAGLNLSADVAAQKAKADAIYQQQYLNERQRLNNIDQQNISDLKSHTDEFANYIRSNPINPKAYLEDMNAGKKITTGLGLFLSGAGSGLSGQPNMAYDFLNKQIDRNIQAQKDRAEQQKTIFGAYQHLYGDQNIATNLAKVSMNDMLIHQAEVTAAQLGTPTAQANLMALKSGKAAENNKLLLESAGLLSSTPNAHEGTTSIQENEGQPGTPPQAMNLTPQDLSPSGFGMPKSEAAIMPNNQRPKPLIEPDEYADSPILKPNAQAHLDELRYTPKAKDEIDQIKSQYDAAVNADQLLNQLHNVHQTLYKDAVAGGKGGYLRRHDVDIPLVGGLVNTGIIKPATATPINKEYDALRSRITGDIATALKGTNVGGEEIDRMVNVNLPEPGDSPELVATKERNIRIFIKNSLHKGLLKDWGLMK